MTIDPNHPLQTSSDTPGSVKSSPSNDPFDPTPILTDKGVPIDSKWEAPKLISEVLRYVNLGPRDDGGVDAKLREGAESLVRGLNQIVSGIMEIRNAHGSAAHGADAYSPLLDSRYAEIMARATDSVVGLLFKTHLSSAQRDPLVRFRYGEHP